MKKNREIIYPSDGQMRLHEVQCLIWLLCYLFVSTQSRFTRTSERYGHSMKHGGREVPLSTNAGEQGVRRSALDEVELRRGHGHNKYVLHEMAVRGSAKTGHKKAIRPKSYTQNGPALTTSKRQIASSRNSLIGEGKLNQRYDREEDKVYERVTRALVNSSSSSRNTAKKDVVHGADKDKMPPPMEPFHVVATSAVIKNRGKKPKALTMPKAIHIWGPTPFKTIMEKLANLNNNLRRQQGAMKRLMLPRFNLIDPSVKNVFQGQNPSIGKKPTNSFLGSPGGVGLEPKHVVFPPMNPPAFGEAPERIFIPPAPVHPPPLDVLPAVNEVPEHFMAPRTFSPEISPPSEVSDYTADNSPAVFEEPQEVGEYEALVPVEREELPQEVPYVQEHFHHHHHHHLLPKGEARSSGCTRSFEKQTRGQFLECG